MTAATDPMGVEFRIGDDVRVLAWGAPVRLIDTGRTGVVTGFTHHGNVKLTTNRDGVLDEPIAKGSAVRPSCLGVMRRDGQPGWEGNVTR
jgi:hypothetical protein